MLDRATHAWRQWGQRTQLVLFLLLGTGLSAAHHLLCRALHGTPIRRGEFRLLGTTLAYQTLVSAGSNAIALLIKYCFSATISVAFSQHFWHSIPPFSSKGRIIPATPRTHTKSRQQELEDIDAPITAASGNPFLPSSIKTWLLSPGLATTSLLMLLLVLIPTFAPGSIRVITPDFGVPSPCTIQSPNITLVDTDRNTQMATFANTVIISGSHLPIPSPCGRCAYNVTFVGTSFQCTPDATYNFSGFKNTTTDLSIYRGTLNIKDPDAFLRVATRGGTISAPTNARAVRCSAHSTEYTLRVWHNATSWIEPLSSTVLTQLDFQILRVLPDRQIQLDGLSTFAVALGLALNGGVAYNASDSSIVSPHPVPFSPLFHMEDQNITDIAFSWPNMETALPSLMQNLTFSLLSHQFRARENGTYFTESPGLCWTTQPIYEYTAWRLLTIYGMGWGAAAVWLVLGFWHVGRNGRERDLTFSNLVEGLDIPKPKHKRREHRRAS
ncbi:hypothetical protein DFP72DRAFT_1108516 [Ephemerocybe angulata]|uniref:Transmembrane protein n=1 Tax=Ephemerocybe angulata TaxID=980116 RepID=A0A8H6MHM0_9AGAR|nr:hypothetical protein DFP72DRAFT_1108516 [Tulosesus angulatus]